MSIKKISRNLNDSTLTVVNNNSSLRITQLIVLDFDGAEDVSYTNTDVNVTVNDIDVKATVSAEDQQTILQQLNGKAPRGVLYISSADLEKAEIEEGVLYSTIYVGDTDAFESIGSFSGIAETTGASAEATKNDNAYVITNGLNAPEAIAEVIEHEAGHLMGTLNHDYGHDGATLDDYYKGDDRFTINRGARENITSYASRYTCNWAGNVFGVSGTIYGSNYFSYNSTGIRIYGDNRFRGSAYISGTFINNATAVANEGVLELTNGFFSANDYAVYNFGSATATLTNNYFSGNGLGNGNDGPAVTNYGTITLVNNNFAGNEAYWGTGGAVMHSAGNMTISGSNTFGNNFAAWGGALATRGGILIVNGSNKFTYNSAGEGGAACFSGGTITVSGNNNFNYNRAGYNGGAIIIHGAAQLTLENGNNFVGNTARWGGALYNGGTLNILGNNSFVSNNGEGGILYNWGTTLFSGSAWVSANYGGNGGAIVNQGTVTITAADSGVNTFIGNYATGTGGVLHNVGDQGGTVTVNAVGTGKNIFSGNWANVAGVFYNTAGKTLNISTAQFIGNAATWNAGAIWNYGAMSLSGVSFESNRAVWGGAIQNNGTTTLTGSNSFIGNSATSSGGAIYNESGFSMTFSDAAANFVSNSAINGLGGALFNAGSEVSFIGSASQPNQFTQNWALSGGGAIYHKHGTMLFNNGQNTVFTSNSAGLESGSCGTGGAVYNAATMSFGGSAIFSNNCALGSLGGTGGAVYNEGSVHFGGGTEFTSNGAGGYGDAIFNWSSATITFGSNTVNKFLNNSGGYGVVIDNQGYVTFSDGTTNTFSGNSGTVIETGNFAVMAFGSGSHVFIGNSNGNGSSGIIMNTGSLYMNGYTEFTSNYCISGGTLYNVRMVDISGTTLFSNNSAKFGGAIYNTNSEGKLTLDGGASGTHTFTSNKASTGGAIFNAKGNLTLSGAKNIFNGNQAQTSGGAIVNSYGSMWLRASSNIFSGNTASAAGGAIVTLGSNVSHSVLISGGLNSFAGNTAGTIGGAIHNTYSMTLSGANAFTGNTAGSNGGAIANADTISLLGSGNNTFTSNKATAGVGGAIQNLGTTTLSAANNTFTGNTAGAAGGAIFNNNNVNIQATGDNTFTSNTAAHGGAIMNSNTLNVSGTNNSFNGNVATTSRGGAIENISVVNISALSSNIFSGNTAAQNGGAIWNSTGTVTIQGASNAFLNNTGLWGGAFQNNGTMYVHGTTTLQGNKATNSGGAFYNESNASTVFSGGAVGFISNSATGNGANGGGIANYGKVTFSTGNVTFSGNYAKNAGGAIYNDGTANATVLITGGVNTFNNNSATGWGGGIYNANTGVVTISAAGGADNTFNSNTGFNGGAIFNNNVVTITGGNNTFNGNIATNYGGAICNDKSMTISATGTNMFSGNKVTSFGGAIQNYSSGMTITGASNVFSNNTTALYGGAIHNQNAVLNLNGSNIFSNNSALGNGTTQATANGGALAINGGTVNLSGTNEFVSNYAQASGGAITNIGGATLTLNGINTFRGNVTSGKGGAIYNSGTVKLSGTTTLGTATDSIYNAGGTIYNYGTLDMGAAVTIAAGSLVNTGAMIWNLSNADGSDLNAYAINDWSKVTNSGSLTISVSTGQTMNGLYTLIGANAASNLTFTLKVNNTVVKTEFKAGDSFQPTGAEMNFVLANTNGKLTLEVIKRIVVASGETYTLVSGKTYTWPQEYGGAGGMVYVSAGGTLNGGDATFLSNRATAEGGAIYNAGAVSLSGTNTYLSNQAGNSTITTDKGDGGVIYNAKGGVLTLAGNDTFTTNSAVKNGGAIYNSSGTTTLGGTNAFNQNQAKNGGAIYNEVGTVDITGTKNTFSGNVVTSEGGAIYNNGTLKMSNSTTFTKNSAATGGAIRNLGSMTTSGTQVYDANNATSAGGAIHNTGTLTMNGVNSMANNRAGTSGAGIYNDTSKTVTMSGTNTFFSNIAAKEGGAVYNAGTVTLSGTNTFTSNIGSTGGGALYNGKEANLYGTNVFSANSALSGAGGAINNVAAGTLNLGSASTHRNTFAGNKASAGGAVNNIGIATLSGVNTFIGNSANNGGAFRNAGSATFNGTNAFSKNLAASNGAAIDNTNTLTLNGVNTFTENAAQGSGGAINNTNQLNLNGTNTFSGNKAATGGALNNTAAGSAVFSGTHTFHGNNAANGGAIYNDGSLQFAASNNVANFSANSVTTNGGALYNNKSAVFSGTNTFTGNMAARQGGAIYNSKNVEIHGSTTFNGNKASDGGAIYNSGNNAVLTLGGAATDVNIFSGNIASHGGAIYNTNSMTISGQTNRFVSNSAITTGAIDGVAGGAIFNAADATLSIVAEPEGSNDFIGNTTRFDAGVIENQGILNISGINNFIGNSATNHAGVILTRASATTTITGSNTFASNIANWGGALSMNGEVTLTGSNVFSKNTASFYGGAIMNNAGGVLTISATDGNTIFANNSAASQGGAIYTTSAKTYFSTVAGTNNVFTSNSAQFGGAIFVNGGEMVLAGAFYNNKATSRGGAIYNAGGGKINLVSDTTFSGNAATANGGQGGAIYNENGTITIRGVLTLATQTDTIYNANQGTLEWDLSAGENAVATVTNFELIQNSGTLAITVQADSMAVGTQFTLANNFTLDDVTFVMNGAVTITLGADKRTQCGSNYYSLVKTAENNLVLKVEDNPSKEPDQLVVSAGSSFDMKTDVVYGKVLTSPYCVNYKQQNYIGYGAIVNNGSLTGLYAPSSVFHIVGNTSLKGGGALYNVRSAGASSAASANLAYISFDKNKAAMESGHGGAIYNSEALMTLSATSFLGNSAIGSGGAIYNAKGNIDLTGTTLFSGNGAAVAGGVYNNGVMTFSGITTFSSNAADQEGAGALFNTGNVKMTGSNLFDHNVVTDPYSHFSGQGGAVHNAGGSIEMTSYNKFVSNSAFHAGALYNANGDNGTMGTTTLKGSNIFSKNVAEYGGGAIFTEEGTVTVSGSNTFQENRATGKDGFGGGAIYVGSGTVNLLGTNTFVGNQAGGWGGGAVYNSQGIFSANGTNVFTSNGNQTSTYGGGAIYNENTLNLTGTNTFSGNRASAGGGAIYNELNAEANTVGVANLTGTNVFDGNFASTGGGAISNEGGVITLTSQKATDSNVFVNNSVTEGGGGAIYNEEGGRITLAGKNIFSKNEAAIGKVQDEDFGGGAIFNSVGSVTLKGHTEFIENQAGGWGGGAIYNSVGTVATEVSTTFAKNSATFGGGAVFNEDTLVLNGVNVFSGNYASGSASGSTFSGGGGAIYNLKADDGAGSTYISGAAVFSKNSAYYGGGAIVNEAGTVTIDGAATFASNTTYYGGGAIFNIEGGTLNIGGSATLFDANHASGNAQGDWGGGAIFNSNGTIHISGASTIFRNNVGDGWGGGAIYNSVGNVSITASEVVFVSNSGNYGGGAIYNEDEVLINGSKQVLFSGNFASVGGGAIYNEKNPEAPEGTKGLVTIQGNNTFERNSALSGGGAIANDGGTVTLDGTNIIFSANTTSSGGGAIYNFSNATLNLFGNNQFLNNTASGDVQGDWGGGAIFNSSGTVNLSGSNTFKNNIGDGWGGGAIYNSIGKVTINGTTLFESNSALKYGGGAIYNEDRLMLSGSNTFSKNQAVFGGAIYNEKNPETSGTMGTTIVDGLNTFADNVATSNGGAIANDGGIMTFSGMNSDDRNTFTGNKALNGGAVYNFSGGMMNIWGSNNTFAGNIASVNGGAVYNDYGSDCSDISLVTVRSASFNQNSAAGKGGAMYNNGKLLLWAVNFSGNSAGQGGGAIYHAGGTMDIIGDITLSTEGDTIENYGILNWNLQSTYYFLGYEIELAGYATLSDYSLLNNHDSNGSQLCILVEAEQAIKTYTLAHHAGDVTGKDVFDIKGLADPNVSLTVNGYGYVDWENSRVYTLVTTDGQDLNLNVTAVTVNTTNRLTVEAGGSYNLTTGSIYTLPAYQSEDGGAVISNAGTVNGYEQRFSGNAALYDGGVIMNNGTISLNTVQFTSNVTLGKGGAVYNQSNGVLNLKDAAFSGNYALFEAGAIYNKGQVSMVGTITLGTENDSIVNHGTLNWDLTDGKATISDYSIVHNAMDGSLTVTLDSDQSLGRYVLAQKAYGDLDGKDTFTINGITATSPVTLTAGGSVYNDTAANRTYALVVDALDQLTLLVGTTQKAESISGAVTHIVVESGTRSVAANDLYALKTTSVESMGGAVYVKNGATLSGGSAAFVNNNATDGGAVYNAGITSLSGTMFYGNTAVQNGGAVYNNGTLNLTDVQFKNNGAVEGGAIYNANGGTLNLAGQISLSTSADTLVNDGTLTWDLSVNGKATVGDYTLVSNGENGILGINVATTQDFGSYVLAENAIGDLGSKSVFRLTGANNVVSLTVGGVVYADTVSGKTYSLVLDPEDQIVLKINKTQTQPISGHIVVNYGSIYALAYNGAYAGQTTTAQEGGAVLLNSGYVTGSNALFINNSATYNGGAIANQGIMTLTGTEFYQNKTDSNGGAIYNTSTLNLQDVTFKGNQAAQGGAVYNQDALNIMGTVTLATQSDTIVNVGRVNWDLSTTGKAYISDYALLDNRGTLSITVTDEMAAGEYTLASNASNASDQTFLLLNGTTRDLMSLTISSACSNVYVKGSTVYVAYLNEDDDLAMRIGTAGNNQARVSVKKGETYTVQANEIYNAAAYSGVEGAGAMAVAKGGTVGGGDAMFVGNNALSGNGGAIVNSGTVSLSNVAYYHNTASGNGGAVYNAGTMELRDATFRGNKAANGGAVYNAADALLSMTGDINLVSGTDTLVNAGTLNWDLTHTTTTVSDYSLVSNTGNLTITVTPTHSVTTYVLAENAVGSLAGKDTFTLYGTDKTEGVSLTVGANSSYVDWTNRQVYNLAVNSSNELTLSVTNAEEYTTQRLVVSEGESYELPAGTVYTLPAYAGTNGGGALWNAGTVSGSYVKFNSNKVEYFGGAVMNQGKLTLTHTEFNKNTANMNGGAMYNAGEVNLSEVTFSDNSAMLGGAVFNKGTMNLTGAVTLSTESDTLVNTGTLNWDLAAGNAYLSNYSLLKNNGTLSITVSDDLAAGCYLLADDVNSLHGKNTFTLNGLALQSGITLTANQTVFTNELTGMAYMVVKTTNDQLRLVVGQKVVQPSTGHILVSAGNTYEVATNGIYNFGTYTGPVGGGAILNNGTVTGNGGMFTNNGATANGGAIVNNADMSLTSARFYNNAAANGGAIYNNSTAFLSGNKFKDNIAASQGGAIANYGTMTLQDAAFYGNEAGQGGAVYNNGQLNLQGTISLLTDTDTIYNMGTLNWDLSAGDATVSDYSLIMNDAESGKLTISVTGEQAYKTYILAENAVTVEGKDTFTLLNGQTELATLTVNGIGYLDAPSGRAYILSTTAENQLALHVGLLKTGLSRIVVESEQSHNLAENEIYTYPNGDVVDEGGAILNSGTLTGGGALFLNNSAKVAGGAIYNSGTMSASDLEFIANRAASNGGAILNKGTATLNGASFRGNSVLSGNGGAIYNQGSMNMTGMISLGTETDTIYNADGATLNWDLASAKTTISNYTLVTNQGELAITLDFTKEGGRYVLAEKASGDLSGKDTFSLADTGKTLSVGGIFAHSNNQIYTIQVNTDKELVLEQGAAKTGTTHMVVDANATARLDSHAFYVYEPYAGEEGGGVLLNNGTVFGNLATFLNNQASYDGGAIVNSGTMTLNKMDFYGNHAESAGGAIFNAGTLILATTEFIGNTAANGGAVYNAENATLYIAGKIDLATSTDTIVNAGDLNWLLSSAVDDFDYSISDYSLLTNMGTLSITVDGQQTLGTYVLADNAELTDGKYIYNLISSTDNFTVQTLDLSETGMASYVDNVYNRVYTLSVTDKRQLVLDVMEGGLEPRKVVTSGTEYVVTPGVHRSPLDEGGNGGGSIHVDDGGILTGGGAETRAVFNSNGTTTDGGAIWNGGTTTLSSTDFTGNYAYANGGAVYNNVQATLELSDTALNGNRAAGQGGGIYNAGTAILGKATFSGNTAKVDGGGAFYNANGGTLRLVGSIGLETDTDTLVNNGILDWDLTNATYRNTDYAISDWSRVVNNGTLTVTVGAEGPTIKESTGLTEYVLAHNAADFNSSITVKGAGRDVALTVDGDVQGIAYDGKLYHLEKTGAGTSKDLVLSVSKTDIDLTLVTRLNGQIVKFNEYDGYVWLAKDSDVTIEARTCDVNNLTYTLNDGEVIEYTEAIKIDTTTEETWTYAFTGTAAQSASIIVAEMKKFKIDVTAPEITVTVSVPEGYSDMAIVSAAFTDTGSGIDKMLYSYDGSEWFNYTGTFSVQKNQLADGETIYFKATDIAGNVTTKTESIQGLVDVGIVLLTDNETLTTSTKLVAYALSDDASTTIRTFEWRYGESGVWQSLTTDAKSVLEVSKNGTYNFRATDSNGKIWTNDVTYSNLEVAPDDKTQKLTLNNEDFVTEEGSTIYAQSVTVNNGTLTLAKDSALYTTALTLNGGTLNAVDGLMTVENVIVRGTDNAFTGDLTRQDKNATFKVEKDSNLALSMDQYKELLSWRSFNVDGSIQVSGDVTDTLTQSDIQAIVNRNTIRHVDFGDMELVNFNALTFDSSESTSIGFGDATGTYKADSISVAKGAVIELGSKGKTMDMLEGNDTVAIKANASVNIYSDLKNVSTISIESGATTTNQVTDSSLKTSKVTVQHYTVARFADIAFDDERSGALTIGSFNDVMAESVTGDTAKSNKITVGSNSVVKIGKISEVSSITVAAGTEYKEYSTDEVKTRGITEFDGGVYTGATGFSDKITTNSFTDVTFGRINFATDGLVRTYDETIPTKVISAITTKNSLAVAKNAISVGGKGTFTVNDDVEAINSLTTGNGTAATTKADEVRTVVNIAGNITGTANNDSLKFGNYNTVAIGTYENGVLNDETGIIDFTKSTVETIETTDIEGNVTKTTIYTPIATNDTLSIGTDTSFKSGMVDFGLGTDTLSIGARTSATVNGDVKGVSNLTLAAGTFTAAKGSSSEVTNMTTLTAKKITGNDTATDKITTGSYSEIAADSIDFLTDGVARVYDEDGKLISATTTKNSLNIAKNSINVAGKGKLKVKGDVDAVNSFTTGNGSAATSKVTEQNTEIEIGGNVTGTANNDSLKIGNFNIVKIGTYDEEGELTANGVINFAKQTTFDGETFEDVSNNDTLTIGSDTTFKSGKIDFGAGKDTMSLGARSVATIAGDIEGVNSLSLAAGTYTAANASKGTPEVLEATTLTAKKVIGTDTAADKVTLGNYSKMTVDGLDFLTDGLVRVFDDEGELVSATTTKDSLNLAKNSISVGAKSSLTINGDLYGVNSLTLANGAAASKTTPEQRTVVKIAGNVTGTANNDSFKVGDYSTVVIGTYDEEGVLTANGKISFAKQTTTNGLTFTDVATNDTLSIGNYTTFASGAIDFGAGSNTLTVGKATTVTAGDLSNGNGSMTLSVGATSDVTVGAISNVNKLTISNGSYDSKTAVTSRTSFTQTGAITGTSGKDTLSFGNYVIAAVGDMNLNVGTDSITFGTYSQVTINSLTLNSTESLTIKGGFSTAGSIKTVSSESGTSTLTLASKARLDVGSFVGNTATYSNIQVNMGANSELRVVGDQDAISGLTRIYTSNGKTAATVAASNELATGAWGIATKISGESALKVVALGTQSIAANFTDTKQEVADNDYKSTTAKLTEGYNGWLASGSVSGQSYFEDGSDSFDLVKNSSGAFDLTGWQVQFGENVDSSKSASESLCVTVRTKEGNTWNQREIFADENGIYKLDVASVSDKTSAVRVSVDLKDSNTAVSYKIDRDMLLA